MRLHATETRTKKHSPFQPLSFQTLSIFKQPFSVAVALMAGVAVNQAPMEASVTIDIDNKVATYANDGDSGYYIKDDSGSQRVQTDNVFRMPVGTDGRPRWERCTQKPCTKIPTPQSAPGASGETARRRLTRAESSSVDRWFDVGSASDNMSDQSVKQQDIAAITTLRERMQQTLNLLNTAQPNTLNQAFVPLMKAYPAANAAEGNHPLVRSAERAIALKESLTTFWQLRSRTTASVAGMQMVSCQMMQQGVDNFNSAAGKKAVSYTEQKAPLSLLGLNSCLYQTGVEASMLDYLRNQVEQAITVET
ncbi:hypothetical protein [Synechococcus sp. CCY 9618]|uniref:hypothetical protein n=1 Tax=Synechococcus sp. CCY 9618 TaxID=2815602 RepID=UPI001C230DD6|nr:hypothetical protein [Synechococcus sp. CCY 9618]